MVSVLEDGWTLRAFELKLFQHVQDEQVWLAGRREVCAAIWARFRLKSPVVDACLAVQLVALPALDHLGSNYIEADGALKELVERLLQCLLRSQLECRRYHLLTYEIG